MTDWSAFWIALGLIGGGYMLGSGIQEFGEQLVLAVKAYKSKRITHD